MLNLFQGMQWLDERDTLCDPEHVEMGRTLDGPER